MHPSEQPWSSWFSDQSACIMSVSKIVRHSLPCAGACHTAYPTQPCDADAGWARRNTDCTPLRLGQSSATRTFHRPPVAGNMFDHYAASTPPRPPNTDRHRRQVDVRQRRFEHAHPSPTPRRPHHTYAAGNQLSNTPAMSRLPKLPKKLANPPTVTDSTTEPPGMATARTPHPPRTRVRPGTSVGMGTAPTGVVGAAAAVPARRARSACRRGAANASITPAMMTGRARGRGGRG